MILRANSLDFLLQIFNYRNFCHDFKSPIVHWKFTWNPKKWRPMFKNNTASLFKGAFLTKEPSFTLPKFNMEPEKWCPGIEAVLLETFHVTTRPLISTAWYRIPVQITRSRVNGALLRGMRRQNAVITGNFPLMQRGGHSERFRFFRTKTWKNPGPFHSGAAFLWMRRRKYGPNPNFGGISGNMGRDTHTQPLSYKMIYNSSCQVWVWTLEHFQEV